MIRTLIVDDEPLALDILETYIEQIPELELVSKCNNAIDARNLLQKESIDLIFLDIQMPELTGIEFAKTLTNAPMIVFTTAYPNFAHEGFELNALDYLLKPVSFDRFQKAVNKAIEKVGSDHNQKEKTVESSIDYIFVKADKKFIKVNFDDILYIEGLKDYVIIRTEKSRIITLQTMKSLEDRLPSKKFIRIHRSYIVNKENINAILGNMVEIIERNEAKHLPIGKNYRDELFNIINVNKL